MGYRYFFFIIIFIVFLVPRIDHALGQKQNSKQAVKKILFSTSEAGMGGRLEVSFELVQERGQWNSYQTGIRDELTNEPQENSNTLTHLLITTLDPETVAAFLKSIAVIKPNPNWREFGITPATLKKNLQADENGQVYKFDQLVNDKSVQQAIDVDQKYRTNDLGIRCEIKVVKENRDTIKIASSNQPLCMLPWRIGNRETYDLEISKFFVQAMGKQNYANKSRMQASTLESEVWEKLDGYGSHGPLNPYRWRYGYAKNLSLLKRNFTLSDEHISGTQSRCTLTNPALPANVSLDAGIDIADTASLKRLIRFKDTIRTCLKAGNFVFDYYNKLPGAKIIFETNAHLTPSQYYIPLKTVEQAVPHLKAADPSRLINFFIQSPEGKSQWALLPDNTLILVDRTGDKVAGLPSEVLKNVKESYVDRGHQFVLLDSQGKVLNE